jgi:hypothetical protein
VLACIWIKSAPGDRDTKLWTPDTGKPLHKWCPIKEGIPGEKVIDIFDVIDYPDFSDEE